MPTDKTEHELAKAGISYAIFVSSAFAGICIAFIIGILGVSSATKLDTSLHLALDAFAIALPLLLFTALLGYLGTNGRLAYFLTTTATLPVFFGIGFVLRHMDPTSAYWYFAAIGLTYFITIVLALRASRTQNKTG